MSEIQRPTVGWPTMILAGGMAGGMGWGIRGQYGHETGAMMAGLLIGLVIPLLLLPQSRSLRAARCAALCALGISLGGSMTYGQTVGLTHDADLVGNWDALQWGLMGLFLKGGIWFGFAGVFLATGLSVPRYRAGELALLLICLVFLTFLGIWLFNSPYDPQQRLLPRWYFSEHWQWRPVGDLKPRVEIWGGLLTALIGLYLYTGVARKDRLVRWVGIIAFLSGGIGFAAGQSVQAFHAWHPDLFASGRLAELTRHVNWWNMMEITFGAIGGAGLAWGVWWNRSLIAPPQTPDVVELTPAAEAALLMVYTCVLSAAEFIPFAPFQPFAAHFLVIALLPLICVPAGTLWPYFVTLPLVALPICGKTFRQLVDKEQLYPPQLGAGLFVVVPLLVMLMAATVMCRRAQEPKSARSFARVSLLLTTWLYFWLNFAFFHLPWPWQPWTGRTPSGVIFSGCLLGLTLLALFADRVPVATGKPTGAS